jgi:hypothetical protein
MLADPIKLNTKMGSFTRTIHSLLINIKANLLTTYRFGQCAGLVRCGRTGWDI